MWRLSVRLLVYLDTGGVRANRHHIVPDSVIVEAGDVAGMGHGSTSIGGGYYSLVFYDETSESWIELPSGFSYYDAGDDSVWWFGQGPVDE